MKLPRSLFASLFVLSLALTACGGASTEDSSDSSDSSETVTYSEADLAANTSTSAEEVSKNFLDTLAADGYEAAKVYIAPEYRDDTELSGRWNKSDAPFLSYTDLKAGQPFENKVTMDLQVTTNWLGAPSTSASNLATAEIQGVWWIVPLAYEVQF